MAAVDDVIEAIQKLVSDLEDAQGSADKAASEADDAVDKATAVGDPGPIEAFTEIKDGLETLRNQLTSLNETAGGLLGKAQAIASGGG